MIRHLRIKNFKGFQDSGPVRLAPITLVYGPNSSGKTSLLQSLLLLRQTVDSDSPQLMPEGPLVSLGSFAALINRHEIGRTLGIEVQWSDEGAEKNREVMGANSLMELRFNAAFPENRALSPGSLTLVRYRFWPLVAEEPPVDLILDRDEDDFEDLEDDDSAPCWDRFRVRPHSSGQSASVKNYSEWCSYLEAARFRSTGRYVVITSHYLSGGDWDAKKEQYAQLLASSIAKADGALPGPLLGLESVRPAEVNPALKQEPKSLHNFDVSLTPKLLGDRLKRLCKKIVHIEPHRGIPQRFYTDQQMEHSQDHLTRAFSECSTSEGLVARVNFWLRSLNTAYRLNMQRSKPVTGHKILQPELTDLRTNTTIALTDVGYGIGQLLPILVKGLSGEPRVLCCEQPELHLHPRLQAQLADFIIHTSGTARDKDGQALRSNYPYLDDVKKGYTEGDGEGYRWNCLYVYAGVTECNKQWIVETHSELMILRLQRRIREKVLRSCDVAVLYVQSDEDGATVTELRLDEGGEFIDEWPDGFFDDGYLERYPRSYD